VEARCLKAWQVKTDRVRGTRQVVSAYSERVNECVEWPASKGNANQASWLTQQEKQEAGVVNVKFII